MNAQLIGEWPLPRSEERPLDPAPAGLEFLRSGKRIGQVTMWNGQSVSAIVKYDDVRTALAMPEMSSSPNTPGYPFTSKAHAATQGTRESLTRVDPPRHTELRRMLAKEFMPGGINKLRPRVEDLVGAVLDDIAAKTGPVDLVVELARKLPAAVILEFLGLPAEDSPFFEERVGNVLGGQGGDPEAARQAAGEVLDYFGRWVDAAYDTPGEGLIGRLVEQQLQTDNISREDLQHLLSLLILAGFDTATNVIALGVVALLQNPDQLEWVQEDDSRWANAVEELLRYLSVLHISHFRGLSGTVEIAGTEFNQGDGVLLWAAVANRDPDMFPDPDRLDLSRPEARKHLAFGGGVHQCLGQHLARVELEVTFRMLFKRFPNMRLAVEPGELRYKNSMVYGVEALPVLLEPDKE